MLPTGSLLKGLELLYLMIDFVVSYGFNLYCTIVSPRKAQRPEVE